MSFQNRQLNTVDDRAPEAQLTHDLVHWSLSDQIFLSHVRETVQGRSNENKDIALDIVGSWKVLAGLHV